MPNTEVKGSIAEGSVGPAHARVGRRRPFFSPFRLKKARRRPTAALRDDTAVGRADPARRGVSVWSHGGEGSRRQIADNESLVSGIDANATGAAAGNMV